jgi:F-type H+-transporting ATPase subunit delta
MLKGAIARRYAQAIFEIGRKQNTLDRTLEDVREIARLFAHRKLAYLLREPKIPAQRKETAIRQALASKVLPTSLNLALLVVQRGLVDLMQNIARELEQLVLDDKNQAVAQVTTATKLDEAQLALVKKALERRTGKTILMQTKVEPDILGGVIARVGDQIIDGSIRYRLTALQQQLLTGVASTNLDFISEAEAAEPAAAAASNGRDGASVLLQASQEHEANTLEQAPPAKRGKSKKRKK